MFDTCVDALGVGGRLIVIGFISGYKDQSGWTKAAKKKKDAGAGDESKASDGEEKPRRGALQDKGAPLPVKLLAKSASVRGFFLNNFTKQWAPHMQKLGGMVMSGDLKNGLDPNARCVQGQESNPEHFIAHVRFYAGLRAPGSRESILCPRRLTTCATWG